VIDEDLAIGAFINPDVQRRDRTLDCVLPEQSRPIAANRQMPGWAL
jgi:hypothetical protein